MNRLCNPDALVDEDDVICSKAHKWRPPLKEFKSSNQRACENDTRTATIPFVSTTPTLENINQICSPVMSVADPPSLFAISWMRMFLATHEPTSSKVQAALSATSIHYPSCTPSKSSVTFVTQQRIKETCRPAVGTKALSEPSYGQ